MTRRLGLLFALLSVPSASLAQEGSSRGPFSIHGGRLIGNGESALSAGAGWPGAYFQYDLGISSSFDLGLRGDLLWGAPTTTTGSLLQTHVGLLASAPMRLALSETRKIGMALGLRPGVYLGRFTGSRGARFGDDATGLGFLVEPSILFTIAPTRSVNVVAGARLPVLVLLVPDAGVTELYFPILPFGGLELGLADDLNATFLLAFGPGLHVHEPETGLEVGFQALFGISYLL